MVCIHSIECLVVLVLGNASVFIEIQLVMLEGTESVRTNIPRFSRAAAVGIADVAGFPRPVSVGIDSAC